MNMRLTTAVACAAAALLSAALLPASEARAACSVKTQPIPVRMQGLRPIVTAKVNGREGHFLLDSGSSINTLNTQFATDLKLKPWNVAETGTRLGTDAHTDIVGAAGLKRSIGLVKADQFEFVGAAFRDVPFMASDRIGGVDGLLGQPFLSQVDVEYDFADNIVRVARAEGCSGVNMAYWAKDGQAYSELPLERIDRDRPHTQGSVYINGVRLRAAFDTGSGATFITETAALRAGVKTTDPGVQPLGSTHGIDGDLKTWVGTFSSVKIGDEEIKNTPMIIGQAEGDEYDVLLGADFFMSHHVYVANSQGKIFFTYSGGPVFRAPRPRPSAGG